LANSALLECAAEGDYLGALPVGELIGRDQECEHLRSLLDAVAEGRGHVLLLSGEVGIGKTRLLQELMVEARAHRFLVLTGRGTLSEQGTPYYVNLDALAGLPVTAPPDVRGDAQCQWRRLQALADGATTGGERSASEQVAQQQVFTAVSDLLLLVARSTSVAILLDDLHWADVASLKLLQHLARTTHGSTVLLAGAFRDLHVVANHPDLAELLQTLSRDRLAERLTVRRLSLDETTRLVALLMGQVEVSEEFASFVHRRTKGIPRLIDHLIRSLGGRLELQGEIGAGAMGRVFRAFDRTTGRTVAAKLVVARSEIDLDTLLRFQQEGAVLATLSHPHIVDIYDSFAEEHASCIIMELLDGQSLGHVLRGGPLPLDRAKDLAQQVADALAYAHGQQIVHRDIKPDNVMVLGGDQVKVTDFGIARILQPDTSLQTIATTGMRLGTPSYMAPEQIEGTKIDGRTDIYALGAMLYHMVTGRPPFEGDDALSVAVKHLQEEPVPPSRIDEAIPSDWDALIVKAMAKDPANRFQSADEIRAVLTTLGDRADSRTPDAHRSQRIGAAIAAVLLVAFVSAGVWMHAARGSQYASTSSRIDAYLSGLAAHGQFSGAVLVAQKGHILFDKGFGLGDRDHQLPNSSTTRYPVNGVNLPLSLLVGLKLEEQRKLHDGDRVCSFVSTCPRAWEPMTIRMLLDDSSREHEQAAFFSWPAYRRVWVQMTGVGSTLVKLPAR
jgi:serine/threonine protein kinase